MASTIRPSQSATDNYDVKLQLLLNEMAANKSSASAYSSNYYEIHAIPNHDGNASCLAWLTYLRGDVSLSTISYVPIGIAVSNYFESDRRTKLVTCSLFSVVHEIVSVLSTGFPYSKSTLHRYCNGYNWTVYSCNNVSLPSVCVGCPSNPCTETAILPVATIDPCGVGKNRASISVMQIDYNYRQPPPSILELTAIASNASVSITGMLFSFGEMSCSVFTKEKLSTLSPTSILEEIAFDHHAAFPDNQNIARVVVSGLNAMTTYVTVCTTTLFGATLSMRDVQSNSVLRYYLLQINYGLPNSFNNKLWSKYFRFFTVQGE